MKTLFAVLCRFLFPAEHNTWRRSWNSSHLTAAERHELRKRR